MADMTELKNILRKGTVHSVDRTAMTARVKFGDKGGIISGDLHIIYQPRYIVPSSGASSGNRTETADGHSHAAYLTNWVPEIGSMVLCIMTPDGDGEGFILGGVK